MSDANNPYTTFQQPVADAPQGTIGIQNPLQGMQLGAQLGTTMANNQNINAGNQFAVQQTLYNQQLARQRQARVIELSRKIASGYYPERGQDMAELSQLANPEAFKQMNDASKEMTVQQQHKLLTGAGTVISLLYSGDAKGANDYLDQEAQAAAAGNDQDTLRAVASAKQVIANNKDPKAAAQQLEYSISGIDGSKDMIDSIGKTQLQPSAIAQGEAQAGETASKIPLNKAQEYMFYEHGGMYSREPVKGGLGTAGAPGAVPQSLVEVNSNMEQIDNVLNKFQDLAARGVDIPSGLGGIAASFQDATDANGELAQWRGAANQALITPILEKLKALRPASDTDVKTITAAVGDVKSNPVMAMNALAKERQLLQFYKDSIVAQADYPAKANKGETLQNYLNRVVPMPTFNSTPYNVAPKKGIFDKTQYTMNGAPITKDTVGQMKSGGVASANSSGDIVETTGKMAKK